MSDTKKAFILFASLVGGYCLATIILGGWINYPTNTTIDFWVVAIIAFVVVNRLLNRLLR